MQVSAGGQPGPSPPFSSLVCSADSCWCCGTVLCHERRRGDGGYTTAFMLYTGFIGGAVGGIGDLYGRLQKTVGASERVMEIIDTDSEVDLQDPKEETPVGEK